MFSLLIMTKVTVVFTDEGNILVNVLRVGLAKSYRAKTNSEGISRRAVVQLWRDCCKRLTQWISFSSFSPENGMGKSGKGN